MDIAKLKAFAGAGAGKADSGKGGMVGEAGMARPPMKQKDADLKKKADELLAKAVAIAEDDEVAGHEEMAEHLAGFDPDEDEAPSGVKDVGLFKRAVGIVDPEGKGAEHEKPYAVALALYWLMGGPLEDVLEHMDVAHEAEEAEEDDELEEDED
jgi:hypothetical protein